MLEHVLVQEMSFIEKEDRMHTLGAKYLYVLVDGVEDSGRARFWRQADREANVTIEVASTERSVVTVRESKAVLWQAMSECPKHAGFADARLTGEQDVPVLVARFDEIIDQSAA